MNPDGDVNLSVNAQLWRLRRCLQRGPPTSWAGAIGWATLRQCNAAAGYAPWFYPQRKRHWLSPPMASLAIFRAPLGNIPAVLFPRYFKGNGEWERSRDKWQFTYPSKPYPSKWYIPIPIQIVPRDIISRCSHLTKSLGKCIIPVAFAPHPTKYRGHIQFPMPWGNATNSDIYICIQVLLKYRSALCKHM